MTNALEGRTYMVKSEELTREEVEYQKAGWMMKDRYFREVEIPFLVRNGEWVLEGNWQNVLGTRDRELKNVNLDVRSGKSDWMTVSDKPFGVITCLDDGDGFSVHPIRQRLHVARQIHKGELGRTLSIPSLKYVRQQHGRDYGWVRLRDLAEVTVSSDLYKAIDLVLDASQFSRGLEYRAGRPVGSQIDAIWASEQEIQAGNVTVVGLAPERFKFEALIPKSELWIRRNFAYTILRLQALGVKPYMLQSA